MSDRNYINSLEKELENYKIKVSSLEQNLIEKDQLLDEIFEEVPCGMSILDNDLNIVKINREMRAWYKGSKELVGRKCYEFVTGVSQ